MPCFLNLKIMATEEKAFYVDLGSYLADRRSAEDGTGGDVEWERDPNTDEVLAGPDDGSLEKVSSYRAGVAERVTPQLPTHNGVTVQRGAVL